MLLIEALDNVVTHPCFLTGSFPYGFVVRAVVNSTRSGIAIVACLGADKMTVNICAVNFQREQTWH